MNENWWSLDHRLSALLRRDDYWYPDGIHIAIDLSVFISFSVIENIHSVGAVWLF